MTSFADALGAFRPREKQVELIADGTLLAQYEALQAQLEDSVNRERHSLAEGSETHVLAEQVAAMEPQIAAAKVTFQLRAIGRNAHARLDRECRGEDGKLDMARFGPALISACCVDPVMTVDEVGQLGEVLTQGQYLYLLQEAHNACLEVDGVPFSELASKVMQI